VRLPKFKLESHFDQYSIRSRSHVIVIHPWASYPRPLWPAFNSFSFPCHCNIWRCSGCDAIFELGIEHMPNVKWFFRMNDDFSPIDQCLLNSWRHVIPVMINKLYEKTRKAIHQFSGVHNRHNQIHFYFDHVRNLVRLEIPFVHVTKIHNLFNFTTSDAILNT
jgi:hypothetical protein